VSRPALSLALPAANDLPDVQAEAPAIPLVLDEAGISDLRYPVTVHLADGSRQPTVATVSFAASVPADTRGVHMSRFVETLHDWHNDIAVDRLPALLADLADRTAAEDVVAALAFPVFLERTGPISGGSALVAYDCAIEARLATTTILRLTVRVPITSLCPCSREISDYGAHNQRGSVEITAEADLDGFSRPLDFGDLIAAAETAGSAPIYTLLKRTDERHVTMRAYENPAFVEDITRTVAAVLQSDPRIRTGYVRVVNEESIHSHNAYASVTWKH
jgi:GTP cyclohydrolase FolE2